MQIDQEHADGVSILTLNGRLDELATTEAEAVFTQTLHDGNGGLILDLSGVEYVSSSGLRILLMLSKAMKKQQRTLKLCHLSPFVAEVFEISNFAAMFEIYDDIAVARQEFGSGPA